MNWQHTITALKQLHFLRPGWLWALLFLLVFFVFLLTQKSTVFKAWERVCDKHLLSQMMHLSQKHYHSSSLMLIMLSTVAMVIALAGPAWQRMPTPTYQHVQPRVLLLDLSSEMLRKDISPDRLSRAKFKLHDLLKHRDVGQFALVAFTEEPFVVSPLTDDGQTIAALLPMLTPDIMPVNGYNLSNALREAAKLISQAGFQDGQILVLTGTPPTSEAIRTARSLAKRHIEISIIPMIQSGQSQASFAELAHAGRGQELTFSDSSDDIKMWLTSTRVREQFDETKQAVPVWRDEGRWFLIPALLCLLPAFRRGWSLRVVS